MLSYVRMFYFCPEKHVVNDGFECFQFSDSHLEYIQKLSAFQGSVVDNAQLPELDNESSTYGLVIPQLDENQITKPIIHTDLPFDFYTGFDPLFNNENGKKLSIFIFKDIGKYWSEINKNDNSDYRMGIFITNEQINISHLESRTDHTPCLKCHYLNVLGNYMAEDNRNNEWQQFFHYLMKNDLSSLASRPLVQSEQALLAGILYQVTASRLIFGYASRDGFTPFDCGAIHMTSLSKTKAKMHWNYQCECSKR